MTNVETMGRLGARFFAIMAFAGCVSSQLNPTTILGTEPDHAWVRPVFSTRDGEFDAGTAFVATLNGQNFLLTAQHLFGPDGGLEREIPWSEMRNFVTGVVGSSPFEGISVIAGPPLLIEGAKGMNRSQVNADLAIFPLRGGSRIHALPLSTTLPYVGETVWLIAEVMGGVRGRYRHQAVVEEATDAGIYYGFKDAVEIRATSGAPVVNEKGQVVAMNLGGGQMDRRYFGIGNPCTTIIKRAEAAIRGNP